MGFNTRHQIGEIRHPFFISAANLTNNSIHKFTLVNNELQLKPVNREIIILPRAFIDLLCNEMTNKGMTVLQKDKTTIRTEKTSVTLS